MTYTFPPSLHPLRDYLKKRGFSGDSIKTSRQAAFVAQQLLNSRIKFPPQGSDMTPILLAIQAVLTNEAAKPGKTHTQQGGQGGDQKPKKGKSQWANLKRDRPDFGPHVFAEGVHIFCDGAAVPNPGVGGWGVVVYIDGDEINSRYGGEAETTNNRMEMTGLLAAIEEAWKDVAEKGLVTIWCDSQYCVEGVNTWMPTWKARGWNKRKLTSPKREDHGIKNLELWQAIDKALEGYPQFGDISIKWVKGHVGVVGNERADELAEMGRQAVHNLHELPEDDLDAQYRAIMAG